MILIEIFITKHAKLKMVGLGISTEDIKKAIRQGSRTKQTDSFLSCYGYYCVAYKIISKETYKIKTVYLR